MIAVLLLGMAVALPLHREHEARRRAGRELFIAAQSSRWDRFYSQPHHLAAGMAVGVSAVALSIGAYELIVAGLCWTFKRLGSNETKGKLTRADLCRP